MLTFKKRLVAIIILALFSTATIVSCGKQGNTDTEEHAEDDHPSDSAEHPSDSTEHQGDHPEDPTQNQ